MDDLIAFVRARLRERERDAQAIRDCEWFHGVESDAEEQVLRLSDPDSVLRDVESKRAVVDEHQPERPDLQQYEPQACAVCFYDNSEAELYPCPTLRHLASVWSDHPDYDAERWAP